MLVDDLIFPCNNSFRYSIWEVALIALVLIMSHRLTIGKLSPTLYKGCRLKLRDIKRRFVKKARRKVKKGPS